MIAAKPSAIFTGSPAISLAGKSIIQGKGVAMASRFTAGGKVSMGATMPERNIYGIISKRSIAAAFSLQKQKVVNTSCSRNLSKNAAIIAKNPKKLSVGTYYLQLKIIKCLNLKESEKFKNIICKYIEYYNNSNQA